MMQDNAQAENLPIVMSVPELAEVLRIGRNNAYQLVRDGAIASIRIGKSIRIPRQALLDFLSKM